ncbi:hypothetical protein CYPRO_1295 [Cyclonatronum proteinivorum]|uniref:MYXO-CTERM domain-containing protein n=1 Tax=Cyclonatronum proteinivorum TaxID=1457365 RepID=A0A345UJA0_9BACT|nr:hypothetical protein [Cyclonatronum proteinivorum]AXJ00552.1 hypothetical protein CYPRO_1295 [Cyclonatronum proteinivorum]
MKRIILSFVTLFLIALLAGLTHMADAQTQHRDQQIWQESEQTQPMQNPGPPQLPGAPTQTPVGSGLGILLMAGGAYALRRLGQQRGP